MNYSDQQLNEIVIAAVARSLACDQDEITADASLVEDLGMDSLDFLDVIFSLEKTLQIKLLGGELNKFLRPDKTPGNDKQDPYLTHEEIDRMGPFLPALKIAANNNEKILRLDLYKLITSETLIAIIIHETRNNVA